ncbi:YncE family protein [Geofilum sp. OHC36d9]|uniref:YncE family protein n=1 Tax=Geofilum sp. OHC36d9 TaxID=3458413 RepID=UPI0040349A8D
MNILLAAFLVLAATSCTDDNETSNSLYTNGAFILNEGTFGQSNASVSFYSYDDQVVVGSIFKKSNGTNTIIGDVLQDMEIVDDKAYLIVNASNSIQVVNKNDFTWVTTIEGLSNPRFATHYNGKLYVSQWGSTTGSVAVIDLDTNTIVNTIETGSGTEGIIVNNDLIWAANSGGYGVNNTISIIDPNTNEVINTVDVSDGPKHFAIDNNNDVWVICFGSQVYDPNTWDLTSETGSALIKLSGTDQSVLKTIEIGDQIHPSHLEISTDKQTLYTDTYTGIFAIAVDSEIFPTEPLISGYYYGFSVNPANGDIYTCESPDFTKPGTVTIYNNEGEIKSELNESIGIGPNSVIF